jgi:hypothetical protein
MLASRRGRFRRAIDGMRNRALEPVTLFQIDAAAMRRLL